MKVAVTTTNEVWIVNKTDKALDIEPGELFGFGLGQYVEAKPGRIVVK